MFRLSRLYKLILHSTENAQFFASKENMNYTKYIKGTFREDCIYLTNM